MPKQKEDELSQEIQPMQGASEEALAAEAEKNTAKKQRQKERSRAHYIRHRAMLASNPAMRADFYRRRAEIGKERRKKIIENPALLEHRRRKDRERARRYRSGTAFKRIRKIGQKRCGQKSENPDGNKTSVAYNTYQRQQYRKRLDKMDAAQKERFYKRRAEARRKCLEKKIAEQDVTDRAHGSNLAPDEFQPFYRTQELPLWVPKFPFLPARNWFDNQPLYWQQPPACRPVNIFSTGELQSIAMRQIAACNYVPATPAYNINFPLQYQGVMPLHFPLPTARIVPPGSNCTITRPVSPENVSMPALIHTENHSAEELKKMNLQQAPSDKPERTMNSPQPGPSRASHPFWNPGLPTETATPANRRYDSQWTAGTHTLGLYGGSIFATPIDLSVPEIAQNEYLSAFSRSAVLPKRPPGSDNQLTAATHTLDLCDGNISATPLDLSVPEIAQNEYLSAFSRSAVLPKRPAGSDNQLTAATHTLDLCGGNISATPLDLSVPKMAQNEYLPAFDQPTVLPKRPAGPAAEISPSRSVTKKQTQQRR